MDLHPMGLWWGLVLLLMLASPGAAMVDSKESKPIKHSVVKSWADKLGVDLWHLGDFITRRKQVQESFKNAVIVPRSGQKIIETMARDIKHMLDKKICAVQRIMDTAEEVAITHQRDPFEEKYQYYNSKEMLLPTENATQNVTNRELNDRSLKPVYVPPSYIVLTDNSHFFGMAVNTSMSSVHVPTNIYDRTEDVLKSIQWSEKLDNIFLDNYDKDQTLSWQFFGSATGFMRQFPASKWKYDPVDLFDCRLRSWYIEAATSPKDMVILMDVSGSMKGTRKDIARHVVYNILETLGPNDFVNIYKFAEHVDAVVPCFNETLVQATLANKRELQIGLETFVPNKIANYSAALRKAFETLQDYRLMDEGAQCNQAIMLVTDGVPYDFTSIFEEYNWQNSSYMPVRIFTYLIGKEVADVTKTKEMACTNQGYYVHLSTLPEVREQVLKYLPVMARPLVLGRDHHPVAWSQVYADTQDPLMTDWLWETKESEEQKQVFHDRRDHPTDFDTPAGRRRRDEFRLLSVLNNKPQFDTAHYNLVTTVSMPVFDRRENATSIANLLGVAGTDVPIREIQKLMMPFMLGVNGYAFVVTNNGYLLSHPDLRPVFQENILKPSYNSVDMVEVELLDDNSEPRNFSKELLDVRDDIINQKSGSKYMMTKYHFDSMKRVARVKRQYYWAPLLDTPFTLVITYPEPYGVYRIQHPIDSEMTLLNKGYDLLSFFNGSHWKIHPDWDYCNHSNRTSESPEQEFRNFLQKFKTTVWKWKDRTPQSTDHTSVYCDRNLVQGLVFDAKATEWFQQNFSTFNNKEDKGHELKHRFGISVAFLATHSGLTRWKEIRDSVPNDLEPGQEHDFSKHNSRSVDEIWYKRAVEQHFVEPKSFVFSVPFNGNPSANQNTLVTASHAIFHTEDKKSAPVAVVGYQFQFSALYSLFKNTTSKCGSESCERACFSLDGKMSVEVECFVLDNNGYVIVAQVEDYSGKFFGEVRGHMMKRLVEEEIFQKVSITDYQAVCFDEKKKQSPANRPQSSFGHLMKLVNWLRGMLTWSVLHFVIYPIEAAYTNYDEYGAYDMSTAEPADNHAEPASDAKVKAFEESVTIKRTRLQPCDQVIPLYTLAPQNKEKSVYRQVARGCERPFSVHPIPGSNLILLVTDTLCTDMTAHIDFKVHTTAKEHVYTNDESLACHKINTNLRRQRPKTCINQHVNESSIKHCGGGSAKEESLSLMAMSIVIGSIFNHIYTKHIDISNPDAV